MRYLVVFENEGGYEYVRKRDIVTSYDINHWGDRKALRWAKDAQALTKKTVVLRQTKKGYQLVD